MAVGTRSVLVTTDEVAARRDDPELRILDVDEDTEAYGRGHLRNAQGVNWRSYGNAGVTPDARVVAYCRIGERSAPTWFVLHERLGYPDVRNYDGSWTEWGSMVGVPIER